MLHANIMKNFLCINNQWLIIATVVLLSYFKEVKQSHLLLVKSVQDVGEYLRTILHFIQGAVFIVSMEN